MVWFSIVPTMWRRAGQRAASLLRSLLASSSRMRQPGTVVARPARSIKGIGGKCSQVQAPREAGILGLEPRRGSHWSTLCSAGPSSARRSRFRSSNASRRLKTRTRSLAACICHIRAGTGLAPACICTGTGLPPATSAPEVDSFLPNLHPGWGPPLPHLHRDCLPIRPCWTPSGLRCSPSEYMRRLSAAL